MNAVLVVDVDPKEFRLGRHDRRPDVDACDEATPAVVLGRLAVGQHASLQHKVPFRKKKPRPVSRKGKATD